KVFLPDPLTSAGQVYGGVYADNGDADNAALNDERYDVTMVVDFANDTFRLTSPLVEIQNFSNPVTTIAISTVPNFDFTRTQKEFEDVNCFYHLTTFQNYMQSLGFALVNYQLGVDAHALNGADNSMFNFPRLYFGDGCVDDAEDADVIIHEYGHAITASAAPNTWIGSERKALDEGAGDYLATSYTRMLNSFNWELMFGWDGHSSACWPGRTAATTKQYPAGLTGDIHADGEIWSSTLMQIWEVLGRETTDQIFLQSLYSYAQNISMTDAAYMFLDADSLLNGGANYVASYYWFEKRGILPPLPFFSGTDGNGDMATCPGSCDASVVAIPISGVAPYTYLWKDSTGTTLSQITDTITGLCPGNYTAFITDATGDTVTVNIAAREPGQLSIANSVVNESCSFCSDGTVSARVTGGNPPYSYQWNDPSGQTTRIATGLDSGYYQVSIVDVNGCTYLDSALVEVDSPTEFGLGFSSVSDPLCIGACSGSIQVVAYLGLPPYTYLWSTNGAETTSMVTDLCEGTYGVTISDSNGDSIVGSTSLSEPSAMTHTISTTADSGNFGGTASVVVTNGAAPLTYSWSDTGTQTTATATGLAAGEYSVTWEDANGCTGSALDTVDFYMAVYEDVPGEVSIFPNPTTGRLYIRSSVAFGELHIHIANLLGQTVYESNVQHGGQIDISNYKPGLYSITLTNDKAIMLREKLILL
ncbi:MAG: T9SS type A sorting domain-containing protein, partial [Flavobacteriales bacterium]|nr:T9SS type A sorting domain-containing protein [Flavobacteriales bacterium]